MGGGLLPGDPEAAVRVRVRVFVRFWLCWKTEASPGGEGCAHSPWRCRPRKRPSDRPCPGGGGHGRRAAGTGGGGGGGHGRRARGCARSRLGCCVPRRLQLGLPLGRWPRPTLPRRPRPRPAHAPRLAGERGGAEPAGARALVLLPRRAAG